MQPIAFSARPIVESRAVRVCLACGVEDDLQSHDRRYLS